MFVISLLSTCISLALLSTTPSNAATLVRRSTGTFTGQGTYYGANRGQAGNCALDEPILDPQSVDVVAINFGQYDGGAVCGTCVEVTGAAGTVVARVTDKCPSCAQGDLDLSEEMFPKIDDPAKGRVPISWSFVPCPDSLVADSLVYKIKEGSTGDWLEIQVRNHRTRLASLDMSSDGGSTWKPLSRTEYNYWVGRGVGNGPYAIRVTNDAGDQVTDNDIPFQIGIVSGKATI